MKKPVPFHDIPAILGDIRRGRMVVVVDDEDRENEGDLVMAAERSPRIPSISWPNTAVD